MDTVDRKTRSRIMASVGQRDTGPEMRLRRILHRLGLRYRLHDRKLPGSPDLVFPRFHAVAFVHGCFWHVHQGCKFSMVPSSQRRFWSEKFDANKRRDRRSYDALLADGWRVLIVWECAIKATKKNPILEELGTGVVLWLRSNDPYGEIGAGRSFSIEIKSGRPPRRFCEQTS